MTKEDKKKTGRTLSDVLGAKKPAVTKVQVVLDPAIREPIEAAQRRVNVVREIADQEQLRADLGEEISGRGRELLARAEGALQEVMDDTADQRVEFVFQAIGRQEYEGMVQGEEFRPTKEQQRELKERLRYLEFSPDERLPYNPDTFPPALIHRCMVSPQSTLEDVNEMWNSDNWSQGEMVTILSACQQINTIAQ